ncbi:MAG TPA: 30S ribosomal protein S8 [Phycisphaerae bacterium]|nr:30S ribosomal protein S8 [Phycisphaerae bacterium]
MWSDPIADLLTRIRNGIRNHVKQVMIPRSGVKLAVCQVLKEEGYITDVEEIDDGKQGFIRITLKYGPRGEQVLSHIRRESKGGRRVYVNIDELPRVLNGLGIAVVSTNRGVMSDRKCREQKLGGELLCTVY